MSHLVLSLFVAASLGAAVEVEPDTVDHRVSQQAVDDVAPTEQATDAQEARDLAEKKQWLRDQLVSQDGGRQALRQLNTQLRNATPEQIEQLVQTVLGQRRENAERRNERDLERRIAQVMRREARRQWQRDFAFRRPVGFYPVITWLPSGTQLYAGGVVSPDGRYVRVNATPFFSSVGDVQTFNFATGRVGTIRRRSTPKPQVYYNGLTTRYGVPPKQ